MEETTASNPRRRLERMLGTVIDSKYRIDAFLGRGGMGTVWKAEHLMLHRPVAIKLLRNDDEDEIPEETLQRFRREAALASKLRHDNTVMLHDFGVHGGMPYLVMEFLVGQSLRARIQQSKKLTVDEAATFCRQIADGVAEAHSHGILHRDLKPENVFIVKSSQGIERAVVLDFGVAKLLGSSDSSGNTLTEQGALIGTPHYMSPEQIRGDKITFASDVYALGIILYEMISGSVPFKGDSALSIAWQHLNGSPEPLRAALPDSPFAEGVDRILEHALAKDAALRYQSPRDLSVALDAVVGKASETKLTDRSLRVLPHSEPEGRSWSGTIATVMLVGLVAALGFTLYPQSAKPAAREQHEVPPNRTASSTTAVVSLAQDQNAQLAEARKLAESGKNIEAAGAYKALLERSPDDATLYAELGKVLLSLNQLKEADASFSRAIKLQPESIEIRMHYGHLLLLQQRYPESIAELKKVLEVLPEDTASRDSLGRAYLGTGEIDEAIAQFRMALKADPQFSGAAYNLGEALARKDDLKGAVEAYRQGLKVDSLNAHSLAREAELAAALKKREESQKPSASEKQSESLAPSQDNEMASRRGYRDERGGPEEAGPELEGYPPPPPPHELGDHRYGRPPPPPERGGRSPKGPYGGFDPQRPPPPPRR